MRFFQVNNRLSYLRYAGAYASSNNGSSSEQQPTTTDFSYDLAAGDSAPCGRSFD